MLTAALIAFGILFLAWLAAPAERRRPRPVRTKAANRPMEPLPKAA